MTRVRTLLATVGALALPVGASAQERDPARAGVTALIERGRYADALATAARLGLHRFAGDIRFLRGEWDAAASAWDRAVADGGADAWAARLGLAKLALARGDLGRARREFRDLVDGAAAAGPALDSPRLTVVAEAARHLSRWTPALAHDALRVYDEAIAADSANVEAWLGVGTLFLERYAGSEAAAAFRHVLARVPDHPRALLGLARTYRFAGLPDAVRLAERSLQGNPALVPARVFAGRLHLEREDYAAAEAELHRALSVNPSALEALAALAALRFLTDDTAGYRAVADRALERNARYADLYVTVAEEAARNRRYADAVRLGREAIARDSTAWRAWAVTGINLLRTGEIDAGRRYLETALRGDPFDVWTKNTLDLLDTLAGYDVRPSPRFHFVADGGEADVLALYLAPVAEEAYERLAARYDHRPATPIRVELFSRHADFSVRTVGLAGLGALGVSFGPVIAMDSPSAQDRGTFNWGSTLWHEIAHTFHLALSRHRVPRWLTEGLAVYEERRARPGWGDDLSPGFLRAWQEGRLHPVSRLNDGFLRPAYPEQIAYSYYQASLVCELIETEYGAGALRRMLAAYGDGLRTPEVFRRVLDADTRAFDQRFDAWLGRRFAARLAALADADTSVRDVQRIAQQARRHPGSYVAQLRMAHLLVREGRSEAAIPYFERARTLFPEYAGPDSPYPALAELYAARGEHDRVTQILAAQTAVDATAWNAHLALARRRESASEPAGAAAALEAAMYISPFDLAAHEYLADLYRRLARWEGEIRERRAVVALDPADPGAAWYRLARAYVAAGKPAEARRAVLRALEIAPGYVEAQELLLAIVDGGGAP